MECESVRIPRPRLFFKKTNLSKLLIGTQNMNLGNLYHAGTRYEVPRRSSRKEKVSRRSLQPQRLYIDEEAATGKPDMRAMKTTIVIAVKTGRPTSKGRQDSRR